MSDVVAVIAADTHISDNTWASRSAILGDSFFGFSQLIDLCVTHNCPLVLCGDCLELFRDPRPSASTVMFLRKQIDRLAAAGQSLYFINGQHDAQVSPYWLKAIHDSCEHVGNRKFTLGNLVFYGVDFFEPGLLGGVLQTIPSDVFGLIVHQAWLEFAGNKAITDMSLQCLPEVPLVISGDMHEFKVEKIGAKLCISPGATHARSLREPVSHFCLLLQADGGVMKTPLKSRAVFNLEVRDVTAWTGYVEDVARDLDTAYKLAVSQGIPVEVAMPLLLVDQYVDTNCELVLKERLDFAHVVVRDMTADLGWNSAGYICDLYAGITPSENKEAVPVDQIGDSEFLEKAIWDQLTVGGATLSQRQVVMSLFKKKDNLVTVLVDNAT